MAVTYRKRILTSFLIATIVLLAVASSVFASFREMNRQKSWVDHTYEVINRTNEILSDVKDVQSSQRGFVITGLEEYLVPYNLAIPKIDENMEILGRLVADNPKQAERHKLLRAHVDARIDIANKIVDVYRTQGQEASFAMIRQGSGKREMDEVRAIVAEMIGDEQKLLYQRRESMDTSARLTTGAGISGLIVCLLILVAVFALIHREAEQRVKTEDSLKDAIDNMAKVTDETQLIGRISDYLRSCRSESEAYGIIERNIPVLFPYTYGNIAMFNNSRNLLQEVLDWGELPASVDKEFEPEDCWALRQGRIHVSGQHEDGAPVCEHLHKSDSDALAICLPMQAQGETIGQIFIGSGNKRSLQERQLATLRTAGEQISLALANLKLQQQLKEQSIKDTLTKLFNRRYLEETLPRELSRAQRGKLPLAVLMMDIDFFKKVNDTYGHDGGDAVLTSFARLLASKSRKEDIACRLGGEEFVLVLPATSLEVARQKAEELCEATRTTMVKFQTHTISISVSIGVAIYPDHGETYESLLQNSDLALYKAKHTGRDKVVVYDPADNVQI